MDEIEREKEKKIVDEVFEQPLFKFLKYMQTIPGVWPYNGIRRFYSPLLIYLPLAPLLYFMVRTCKKECGVHLNICGENLIGLSYAFVNFEKYLILVLYKAKFIHIYCKISSIWNNISDPLEKDILIGLSKNGKKAASTYCALMCASGTGFALVPTIPPILDWAFPKNESRDPIRFLNVELPIDPNENYYILLFYFSIMSLNLTLIWNACDATYIVLIYQVSATFDIIKHRMRKAASVKDKSEEDNYNIIRSTIQLHQTALEFANDIEKAYSLFYIGLIIMSVMFISVGVVYLAYHEGARADLYRFILMLIASVIHLLVYTVAGQVVTDRSSSLLTAGYDSEWYDISPRSKKLFLIYLMRCIKPVQYSARGVYIMNLENFGIIVKTAASYIAVVASFR